MAELGLAASDHTTPQASALALVGEQTLWTLMRNAWHAYWGNFRVVVFCALIPVLPSEALNFTLQNFALAKYGIMPLVVLAYGVFAFPASCAGLWLWLRGAFTNAAVAVEGRSDNDAIQRSIQLTKGQVWRLLGLLVPTVTVSFLTSVAVSLTVVAALRSLFHVQDTKLLAQIVSNVLSQGILWPMYEIGVMRLYYEQRVLRESYTARALSEDLAR